MARALIVACGCRGQALARALLADGHAVRGTTRDPARLTAIAECGIEPFHADPDRVGTLMAALEGVTVVCWLLGSAGGGAEQVAALHDGRLRMLFEKLVDTPVRGLVYEAAGTLPFEWREQGELITRAARATWNIPLEVLHADPADCDAWRADARAAVGRLLGEQ